jgi:hypothetical protein
MGYVWLSIFPCPYSHPDLMRSGTTYLNRSAGPGLPTGTAHRPDASEDSNGHLGR